MLLYTFGTYSAGAPPQFFTAPSIPGEVAKFSHDKELSRAGLVDNRASIYAGLYSSKAFASIPRQLASLVQGFTVDKLTFTAKIRTKKGGNAGGVVLAGDLSNKMNVVQAGKYREYRRKFSGVELKYYGKKVVEFEFVLVVRGGSMRVDILDAAQIIRACKLRKPGRNWRELDALKQAVFVELVRAGIWCNPYADKLYRSIPDGGKPDTGKINSKAAQHYSERAGREYVRHVVLCQLKNGASEFVAVLNEAGEYALNYCGAWAYRYENTLYLNDYRGVKRYDKPITRAYCDGAKLCGAAKIEVVVPVKRLGSKKKVELLRAACFDDLVAFYVGSNQHLRRVNLMLGAF